MASRQSLYQLANGNTMSLRDKFRQMEQQHKNCVAAPTSGVAKKPIPKRTPKYKPKPKPKNNTCKPKPKICQAKPKPSWVSSDNNGPSRSSASKESSSGPIPNTPSSIPKPRPELAISQPAGQSQASIREIDRIEYDDLEIGDLLSSGEAGEVYLGDYFGTPCAIKKLFLPPSEVEKVVGETSMLASLRHPNIVQFLGLCVHESGIYIVTEYVENGDLFDLLIFEQTDVSWKDRIKIALQIAQACFYLHSKKVIHRDLKGPNVLIGENYKVKLCDLGLACVVEAKKRSTVCGTDQWMAPEIFLGQQYDHRVDQFSFGLVCTELVTNQPPMNRSAASGFAFDVNSFKAAVPPDCPPDFAQLVIDCTDYSPSRRPPFRDVVARLKTLLQQL